MTRDSALGLDPKTTHEGVILDLLEAEGFTESTTGRRSDGWYAFTFNPDISSETNGHTFSTHSADRCTALLNLLETVRRFHRGRVDD